MSDDKTGYRIGAIRFGIMDSSKDPPKLLFYCETCGELVENSNLAGGTNNCIPCVNKVMTWHNALKTVNLVE